MRSTEAVEFTNMCMIRDGDRVLVQDRLDPAWPGAAFPGGHVETGESFTDAVIREVYEETGLTVLHPRLCGIKDWCDGGRRYVVLLYSAERFSGTLRASREGAVSWVSLADLPKLRAASRRRHAEAAGGFSPGRAQRVLLPQRSRRLGSGIEVAAARGSGTGSP